MSTRKIKQNPPEKDERHVEYEFNYANARPNRFAGRTKKNQMVVLLDADVSAAFKDPESVNMALRRIIEKRPTTRRRAGR